MAEDYEGCIPDFSKVIELKPEESLARTNRGFAFRKLGKYQEALQDFSEVISTNPNAYSYEHRGFVKYLIGNYSSALKDLETSIQMNSANSLAYKTRAKIYIAIENRDKACNCLLYTSPSPRDS